jgi:hypothetical protein
VKYIAHRLSACPSPFQSLVKAQDPETAASAANRMHKNLLVASGLDVVADALADPKQSVRRILPRCLTSLA